MVWRQVGGSFGATCGLLLMRWLPSWNIQPGLYAMCAAAAMLGGVFRASISLVVIFVESSKVQCVTLIHQQHPVLTLIRLLKSR